jgi:hypothetical protein
MTPARPTCQVSLITTIQPVLDARRAWQTSEPGSQPETSSEPDSIPMTHRPSRRSTFDKVHIEVVMGANKMFLHDSIEPLINFIVQKLIKIKPNPNMNS